MVQFTELTLPKLAVAALTKGLVTSVGFSNLKPKQVDAIDAFLKGHDVFVSLPTGYGKSLISAMLLSLFDLVYRNHPCCLLNIHVGEILGNNFAILEI